MSERDGPKSATGMQVTAAAPRALPRRAAPAKQVVDKVSYSSSEEEEEEEEEKPKRAAPKRAAAAKTAKAAESDEDAVDEGDGASESEVSSHARGSPSCRAHACTDTDAFEHTWTMLRAQLARSHTHTHCESLLVVNITLVVCSLVKGEPAKRRKTTNGDRKGGAQKPRNGSQVCTPASGGTHTAKAHAHIRTRAQPLTRTHARTRARKTPQTPTHLMSARGS